MTLSLTISKGKKWIPYTKSNRKYRHFGICKNKTKILMKTKIFALLAVLMIGLTVSCQKNEKEDMMDPSPAEKARLLSSDPCSYPGNGTIKPLTVGYNTEQLSPGKYQWRRKISKNTLNNFRFYVEVIDGGDVTTRSVFYKKKKSYLLFPAFIGEIYHLFCNL